MPSKRDCIRAMTAAGVPENQAGALLDHVMNEKAKQRAAGQSINLNAQLARAIMDAAEAERIRLIRERRNAALTILKRKRLEENTARLQEAGLSFGRAVAAQIWGDRSRVAGARDAGETLKRRYGFDDTLVVESYGFPDAASAEAWGEAHEFAHCSGRATVVGRVHALFRASRRAMLPSRFR